MCGVYSFLHSLDGSRLLFGRLVPTGWSKTLPLAPENIISKNIVSCKIIAEIVGIYSILCNNCSSGSGSSDVGNYCDSIGGWR